MAIATFAAGCFWGVEAAFRRIDGITSTSVGYSGGTLAKPSYQAVCTGETGHAEVVRLEFDPAKVSYQDLLDAFWGMHDPTTLNRQGPDVGSQYRSAVFFHDDAQAAAARAAKQALQQAGVYRNDIVTEIAAASEFYLAEDYHQQYLEKRASGRRRWI